MRLHVVINSCEKYEPVTVPILLASLRAAGVPDDAIHIVVGESEGPPTDTKDKGVSYHRVPYANMDNNAFLWLLLGELPEDDWIFYLHDTCTVDPVFWKNITSKIEDPRFAERYLAARIHGSVSMCIGLYSMRVFRLPVVTSNLLRLVNLDRSTSAILRLKQNLAELEDYVFHLIDQDKPGTVYAYPNHCTVEDQAYVYGTTQKRRCEVYPDPGVKKWKANWGAEPLHLNL